MGDVVQVQVVCDLSLFSLILLQVVKKERRSDSHLIEDKLQKLAT